MLWLLVRKELEPRHTEGGRLSMATAKLQKGKAATKMGASTPSRSRQVAGRERAKVDTSDYSGKIAARVRTLRETASMSVEDLAKKAGIDIKAMYAYEQRTRRIPPEKYPALAKALNCKTPDDFFPPLK
jgi:ribosome-binding protein aMBF1 (putative translation factor)